ncbi:hypothetical protein [Neptunitalea lumnitzerae]|uniref:Tetratricopeptide repeat protein n=1 Tax=Neptunitalea lumnitzerae TaxID=2965509 RepID=A0ABQ5MEJ1_9FLAO|nr:hypothetical protein [Neptunitalea sp. Y10]GLB47804.1 hypothetical protein Y10_01720 [Neptunitalea sp. Y10]
MKNSKFNITQHIKSLYSSKYTTTPIPAPLALHGDIKKLSPQELKELLEFAKLEETNLKPKVTMLLAMMFMVGVIIFVSQITGIDEMHQKNTTRNTYKQHITHKENELIALYRKKKIFNQHLEKGDKMANKKQLHNALVEYTLAKVIFPNAYKVNYRIARTYVKMCKNNKRNCEEATNQVNQLLKNYANKAEVVALKTTLETYTNK